MTDVTQHKAMVEIAKDLGRFLKAEGLTAIEIPGIKVSRSPQETLFGNANKTLGGDAGPGKPQPTDEELLFDPMAGLRNNEVSHGK